MELKGKKINFLGDSITQGYGTSSIEKTFWNVLKVNAELAEARGYGIGGTRFAEQRNKREPIDSLDFCARYNEMDDDADAVVVFGGTNDYGHGDAPIGCESDRTSATFWGACHCLMQGLIEKYPAAVIVIMTPLHRLYEENPHPDDRKQDISAPLCEYVDIIKKVAEFYSLPVLDLWAMSGIQPKVDIIREKYCPDGLHPNDAGHIIIANRLDGFLKTL